MSLSFSSVLIKFSIWFLVIFASGVNLSFFAIAGIIGLLGITGLIIIAPYRLKRIVAFLNDERIFDELILEPFETYEIFVMEVPRSVVTISLPPS